MAKHFEQDFELSQRRASSLAQVSRSVLRYRSKRGPDSDVREQLNRLATERPRFGYRRLTVLLHREGLTINHKRCSGSIRKKAWPCGGSAASVVRRLHANGLHL